MGCLLKCKLFVIMKVIYDSESCKYLEVIVRYFLRSWGWGICIFYWVWNCRIYLESKDVVSGKERKVIGL